ncbi:MAG TPA: hypothetical protein VM553_08260 [Dongiaceae bacterium]|nr:hypothetical protein [Dongiaceae bacterium]
MTISLADATAAVNAIKKVKGMQLVEKNKHLFEKHVSKAEAVAAGGNSVSWFEKNVTMKFSGAGEANKLSTSRLKKLAGAMSVPVKNVKSTLQKFDAMTTDPYQIQVTDDIGIYGASELLEKALKQNNFDLYSCADNADSRFKFVTTIPAGYVGRRITNTGKQKLVNGLIVVIVNASSPVQVVTVYPVPQAWPTNTTDALLV